MKPIASPAALSALSLMRAPATGAVHRAISALSHVAPCHPDHPRAMGSCAAVAESVPAPAQNGFDF
jgi:hypothetical protein